MKARPSRCYWAAHCFPIARRCKSCLMQAVMEASVSNMMMDEEAVGYPSALMFPLDSHTITKPGHLIGW